MYLAVSGGNVGIGATNPELVRQGDDGYYQVSELSQWTLVKAIQELEKENEGLDRENNQLKLENEQQQNQIDKLNQRLTALEKGGK